MSLDIAIDAALKRGATHVSISRMFGVSVAIITRRAELLALRLRNLEYGRMARPPQPKFSPPQDTQQRESDAAAMTKWLAFPIRYDNDPRSHRDGAIRVNLRLSAHARTLGGVADYSSREAA